MSSRHHLLPARAERGQEAGTGAQKAGLGGRGHGGLGLPLGRERPCYPLFFCHHHPFVQGSDLGLKNKRVRSDQPPAQAGFGFPNIKSLPFWGSQRAQPDGLQPRQASSPRHHSGHCGIMRLELGTGHWATGWAAWGWCPGWLCPSPGAGQAEHRAGHSGRHLGVGTNPQLVRTLRTGPGSQGLGNKRAIWALGYLLLPPVVWKGPVGWREERKGR